MDYINAKPLKKDYIKAKPQNVDQKFLRVEKAYSKLYELKKRRQEKKLDSSWIMGPIKEKVKKDELTIDIGEKPKTEKQVFKLYLKQSAKGSSSCSNWNSASTRYKMFLNTNSSSVYSNFSLSTAKVKKKKTRN